MAKDSAQHNTREMTRSEKIFRNTVVGTLGAGAVLGMISFAVESGGGNDPAGPAFNQEHANHHTEPNMSGQSQGSYTTEDGKRTATFKLPPTTEVTDPLPPAPEQYAPGEQPDIEVE